MANIGLMAGYATTTTIKVLVVSDTSDDVSVSCNGSSYVASMTATGTDPIPASGYRRPGDTSINFTYPTATQVCWTGEVTITSLSQLTKYSITAGNASISAMTAPGDTDDFTVFVGTCVSTPGQSVFGTAEADGMFDLIKSTVEGGGLPVVGYVNIDDNLYVDYIHDVTGTALAYNYSSGIGPCRWKASPPLGVAYIKDAEWNAAISYLTMFDDFLPDGLLGTQIKDSDRGWVYKNVNYIGQWGDHEFWNDIGMSNTDDSSVTDAAGFNRCKSAWEKFLGRIQPPPLTSNTNAWSMDFGPLQIVSVDRTTLSSECEDNNGACLGAAQVTDILSAVDANSAPFKIIGMSVGIRSLDTATPALEATGGQLLIKGPQQSMWNMGTGSRNEYLDLFTNAGGMEDLSKGNGTNPDGFAFCTVHGDWHWNAVIRNKATGGNVPTPYSFTHNEDFISFYPGSMTGSGYVLGDSNWVVGDNLDGSSFDHVYYDATAAGVMGIVKIDVYGSTSPKQMNVQYFQKDNLTKPKYSAWYRQGQSGNLPVAPNVGAVRQTGED